ncbi:MAG: Gfo/Idh/MocA family protein [Candidatus Hodarchaeota archaeon]
MSSNKCVTAVLIGAGFRGRDTYGIYALKHPEELKFIAVAEPDPVRRKIFAEAHKIPSELQFESWEYLLHPSNNRLADTAFITTQDQMHTQPALHALNLGYHVLLEKPIATKLEECIQLVKKAKEVKRQLRIAHVLRYTPFFSTVHEIVKSGRLGNIITIDHRENVSYYHYAHSYVRGNWAKENTSSPMILAKSCHDLDIIYWLVGLKAHKISSFGSLTHFRPENAPRGAIKRCTNGCPAAKNCKYYAPRFYIDNIPLLRVGRVGGSRHERFIAGLALDHPYFFSKLEKIFPSLQKTHDYRGYPVSAISEDLSLKGKMDALITGPYGKCVYYSDNDVVDHQVTIIEFPNDVTTTFTMHGFSHAEGRTIRIDGTEGTLIGEFLTSGDRLILHNHLRGTKEVILETKGDKDPTYGHGGGDQGIIVSFLRSFTEKYTTDPLTSAKASLESHVMAFAAEKARLTNQVILMDDFRKLYEI